jgi:tetratricopeptide (TPR) repeat protein
MRHDSHSRTAIRIIGISIVWLSLEPVAANPHCHAGPEAERARALQKQGTKAEGCDAMLAMVQSGTDDPWAYRGAALCVADAEQGPRIRPLLEQAFLQQGGTHPALVAYARGLVSYLTHDDVAAERSLRQALDLDPNLAPVLNDFAVELEKRGDLDEAGLLLERAVMQCPDFEIARRNGRILRSRQALRTGVWDRLLARLNELPKRWNTLPPPVIEPSGREPEEIFEAASNADRKAAVTLTWDLALAPLFWSRAQITADVRANRSVTEVDLWMPIYIAERLRHKDIDKAGLVIEAAFELGEHLGRRDVLLIAAGSALQLAQARLPSARLGALAGEWANLPPGPHGARGVEIIAAIHNELTGQIEVYARTDDAPKNAAMWVMEAEALLRYGYARKALIAYRKGRQLLQDEKANKKLEALAWIGEAQALVHLGQNHDALIACQRGQQIHAAAADVTGEARARLCEAQVLFRLGQLEESLAAFQNGRRSFNIAGSHNSEGEAFVGEARILAHLERNEEALEAYQAARKLFQLGGFGLGNKQGEVETLVGEGDVLVRLGRNGQALLSYREARRLASLKPIEALAWAGEAQVLSVLGKTEGALFAAQRAAQLARETDSVPLEIDALMLSARLSSKLGRSQYALGRAEQARKLLERWRAQGATDLDRTAMSNTSAPYDFLISRLAYRRDGVERALNLAEAAHAPVFRDLLATDLRQPVERGDPALVREREHLHQVRIRIDRELAHTTDPNRRKEIAADRRRIDRELEIVEFLALGSLDSSLVNTPPIRAAAREALVRGVGSVLLYYVAEEETVAFLLRPGARPGVHVVAGMSRTKLEAEVQALRHDLGNPLWQARAPRRQRALFDQLIGPFAPALTGASHLVIIPHGPLHELPFEALLGPDDMPIFTRWQVSISPSLSALHALRKRQDQRKYAGTETQFLGIAGGTGLALPDREVRDIAAIFATNRKILGHGEGRGPH